MSEVEDKVILYTSNTCQHSWAVERFLDSYEIEAELINIDRVAGARDALTTLNEGYASVPTIIFADGSKLVEPSFRQLRAKFDIEDDSIFGRLRSWFG